MVSHTLLYVLETLTNLFVLAVLMRFYAQAFRAPFRNPFTNFIVALTDFAVKPMRRIIPSVFGLDWASFVIAWLVEWCFLLVMFLMLGNASLADGVLWPALIFLALIKIFRLSIYLLIGVLIVQAALSWIHPYHPIGPFFDALSRPFLRPLQRVVPLIAGVDLSPLILILLCQIVLMLPIAYLETEAVQMVALPMV